MDGDDAFVSKASANPLLVGPYDSEETEVGPDPDNLEFDFCHGPGTRWNTAVIGILVGELKREYDRVKDILGPVSDEFLSEIIRSKYIRARTSWRRGRARTTDNGDRETPDALEDRLIGGKERQLARARKRERRANVSC